MDEGEVGVSHDCRDIGRENFTISHLNRDFLVAIEAGAIYTDYLARKEPADRQRIESSLTEPLLFSVDRNTVLSRDAGKGCDRFNQVRIGV